MTSFARLSPRERNASSKIGQEFVKRLSRVSPHPLIPISRTFAGILDKRELEALLEKALTFVPDEEKARLYKPRLRPRRSDRSPKA